MSVTCLHLNSTLFPKPEKFAPDRWLGPRSHGLNQYLVPFSKGPRMCLGIKYVFVHRNRKASLIFSLIVLHGPNCISFSVIYSEGWRWRWLAIGMQYASDSLISAWLAPSLDDFCRFKDYFVPIHQGRQLHIRSKQALHWRLFVTRFTLHYKNVFKYYSVT